MRWLAVGGISVFLMLCGAEAVLAVREWREARASEQQHLPYYSFALHLSDGQLAGGWPALHKLRLHPGLVYDNFPGQDTPYFSIGADGFRGTGRPAQAGAKRIVLLGGSTAFGTGLASDAETFAAHLERLLPGTAVTNAAVIGHASGQELVRLVTELVDLEPRLVVAVDGLNDALSSGIVPERAYATGFSGLLDVEVQLARHDRFVNRNPLRRLGSGLPRLLFPNLMAGLFPDPGPTGQTPLERAARLYVRNVLKMRRISKAFGSAFLCALQPLHPAIYEATDIQAWDKRRFRYTRALARSRFTAEQVEFVDLNDEPGIEAGMYLDDFHLDARGNELMARAVAARIVERGLLD